uniref:Uncharacterized protein n=1 Tax=Leersia perrieri TaxID=77586 RepID=A0A0D9W2V9_9ORYZ
MGQLKTIELLDGTSFTDWKRDVLVNLALMRFDYAINKEFPKELQLAEELNMNAADYANYKWKHEVNVTYWENTKRMALIKKSKPNNPQKSGGKKQVSGPLYNNPFGMFCESDGHWQREYPRFKAWLAKKGARMKLMRSLMLTFGGLTQVPLVTLLNHYKDFIPSRR